MSILIKGMEMPKHCISEDGLYMPCPMDRLRCMQMFAPEGLTMGQAYEERYGKLPSWCPLVPVPTPHGRLIDRDALSEFYRNQPYDPELTEEELRREKIQRENIDLWVLNYIFDRDAPTIIEAEGEDNG